MTGPVSTYAGSDYTPLGPTPLGAAAAVWVAVKGPWRHG